LERERKQERRTSKTKKGNMKKSEQDDTTRKLPGEAEK
jgi:hypothetical protein